MQVTCARCGRVLEYGDERPSYCPRCGQPLPAGPGGASTGADPDATVHAAGLPAGTEEVPAGVGGYRLVRELGRGGMGAVYEAEDASGRRLAVKLIRPEFASSADAVERFRREGRVAGALAHPRCVFVAGADEEAGRPFIVMELMPGATLHGLVRERGPLPPQEAVAHTLDLIEGLQQAHRLGVVHRDVKPSNCFLDAEGRVKVGDFGLAKSLVAEGHLTRTGAFVGTPLFAAPEQLKGEPLDVRADVYGVAATLYYLLTGQAPHQGGDGAAVAARIASEPAPPVRTFRPDVPAGLDRVVLRGLERDRARRWRDLGQFRRALLRFLPARLTIGGMGRRLIAFAVDGLVLLPVFFLYGKLVVPHLPSKGIRLPRELDLFVSMAGSFLPALVYFTAVEGLWGCSAGKWLLGLRVARRADTKRPGLARSALRTFLLWLLFYLPGVVISWLPCLVQLVLYYLGGQWAGGVALVLSTMRPRNGFRGPHELLSGTRVLQLAGPAWADPPGPTPGEAPDLLRRRVAFPADLPEGVGPFQVHGALRCANGDKILWGEDGVLGRQVLLWLRPAGEPPLPAARREAARMTRPRWLGAGAAGGFRWDAFVAPAGGCPLPDLLAERGELSWGEVRPFLRQLADELAASCADGTLPATLTPEQVWVQREGPVLLLDPPLAGPDHPEGDDPEQRSLSLLRRVALRALGEGSGASRPGAALPLHAARILDRLFADSPGYRRVADFRAELAATADRPDRLGRVLRGLHILVQAALFFAGLLTLLALSVVLPTRHKAALAFALGPVVGCALAAAMRGGPSFAMAGLAVVRRGRPAARWRCAWRALLVWAQAYALVLGMLTACEWLDGPRPGFFRQNQVPILLLTLALYALLALWLPRRTLHDRLAGTRLVPE